MRTLFASAAILALLTGASLAADPIGDWLVKEGYAHIRIDKCADKLWGIVAWEKEPGLDIENPDPAKKGRAILGMPILLGMKPTKPNLWEGEIYNSQNGKIYDAKISMANDNTLKLEGCVAWGILCGGENWTRVINPPPGPPLPPVSSPAPQTKAPPAQTKAAKNLPSTKGPVQPALSDVCARITEYTAPPANGSAKK